MTPRGTSPRRTNGRRSDHRALLPGAVCALLIISSVSWRADTYFSGGLDPVVILKALLSGAALCLSVVGVRRAAVIRPLGMRSLLLLTAYLAVTCLGGWAAAAPFASAVVAVRVAVLAATIMLLLHAFDVEVVLSSLIRAMGAVGIFAALTGLPTLSSGRLSGGLPPLSANGVANLCAVPMIVLIWRVVEGRPRGRWDPLTTAGLLLVIILTGSRTTLATLLLAVLVMVIQMRRLSALFFVGLAALVPASVYLLFGTPFVSGLASRGGAANVTTLSSRTIAWEAAIHMTGTWWQHWFGGGLALKQIPVAGQYWSTQILDSSIISALVQGGLVGLAIGSVWIVTIIIACLRCGRPWRSLWLGLLAFTLPRSILESGLLDATPDFLLLMVVSLVSEPLARHPFPPDSGRTPHRSVASPTRKGLSG